MVSPLLEMSTATAPGVGVLRRNIRTVLQPGWAQELMKTHDTYQPWFFTSSSPNTQCWWVTLLGDGFPPILLFPEHLQISRTWSCDGK